MAGLTYSTYVSSLANLAPVNSADAGFQADLPNIIDDAEQRIYRELDLLNTVARDSSATFSTSTRTFNLPSALGTFVVVEDINVITPAGTTDPEQGTRNALLPSSKEYLDFTYPSATGSTVPVYFGMVSQSTIVVGPWPDAAYTVEVVGTIRPPALSSTNVTTLISVYFPDLLLAASMVRLSGYQKNYGAGVDDPKQSVTWESHYQALKASAEVEENRKKFTGAGWSSKQPAPLATPPRT